jgi:hypothetical protein
MGGSFCPLPMGDFRGSMLSLSSARQGDLEMRLAEDGDGDDQQFRGSAGA